MVKVKFWLFLDKTLGKKRAKIISLRNHLEGGEDYYKLDGNQPPPGVSLH